MMAIGIHPGRTIVNKVRKRTFATERTLVAYRWLYETSPDGLMPFQPAELEFRTTIVDHQPGPVRLRAAAYAGTVRSNAAANRALSSRRNSRGEGSGEC